MPKSKLTIDPPLSDDAELRRDNRLVVMRMLALEIEGVRTEEAAQAQDLKATRKRREELQEQLEALAKADDNQTNLMDQLWDDAPTGPTITTRPDATGRDHDCRSA